MNRLIALAALLLHFAVCAAYLENVDPTQEQREAKYYRLETIAIPTNIVLEVGGMAFMNDGRLMVCTRRGEVWSLNSGQWQRFAHGLDEAMGVCVISSNQIVVAQRPELTRITDSDNDGVADRYDTLTDAWNYSGHIYEWNFGPVRDRKGNLFGTLTCWYFPSKQYDKPPYSGWEIAPPVGWKPASKPAWRGWSYKVTSEGEFVPFSSGLRSPNGVVLSADDDLFATDNQGEYYGTCVLNHLSEGAFHGHANGLFWGETAAEDPFAIPLEELAVRRKAPAILFPYRTMGQSAAEPLFDHTGGRFGPFTGQMFVGDQTASTIMRVALEKVAGEYQGACFPFRTGFQSGNNRHAFGADGSLWIGQTDRGWPAIGGRPYGLQKLIWTGETPFEIQEMKVTPDGFNLVFTKLINPAGLVKENFSFQRYYYAYHRSYGSPQMEITSVTSEQVAVGSDGKTVSIKVPLLANRIFELHIKNLEAADGDELLHPVAYYTLNRLAE